MIEQTARVVSTKPGHAWVIPQSAASCGACQSSNGCNSPVGLFAFLKPDAERLYVANPLHAKPGDEVVIGMQGNALVIYSVLAYLFPLISLIAFAFLGSGLFLQLGMEQELGSILGGVAGLLSGLKLASWVSARVSRSEEARPVILRHKEQIIYPAGITSQV